MKFACPCRDNNIGLEGATSVCEAAGGLRCICLGISLDIARAILLSGKPAFSRVNMPKLESLLDQPAEVGISCVGGDRAESGIERSEELCWGQGGWLEVRALLLAGGASTALSMHALSGLRLLYDQPYSHKTNVNTLRKAAAHAGCTHVVVGAARVGEEGGLLKVAAAGAVSAALGGTAGNETRMSHGVHWYCSLERGFGFAPNDDIALDAANPRDSNHPTDPLRLSWRVDGEYGGYRAGDIRDLFLSSEYRKLLWGFRL